MTRQAARRFTLADAMVLVAAVAVGLGLSRAWSHYARMRAAFDSRLMLASGEPWATLATFSYRTIEFWPVVAAASPALIVLRLRQPRPRRARLLAPPGIAACVAATLVMILEASQRALHSILFSLSSRSRGILLDEDDVLNLVLAALAACSSVSVSLVVVAVWVVMILARRWRPEPGWIDRAGRAVGWAWIVLIPVRFSFDLFYYYL